MRSWPAFARTRRTRRIHPTGQMNTKGKYFQEQQSGIQPIGHVQKYFWKDLPLGRLHEEPSSGFYMLSNHRIVQILKARGSGDEEPPIWGLLFNFSASCTHHCDLTRKLPSKQSQTTWNPTDSERVALHDFQFHRLPSLSAIIDHIAN